MTKIPFDIKYRPQIESGEYKVETRDGRSVEIVKWDFRNLHGKTPILAIIHGDYDYNRAYSEDGYSIFESDKLFIVTPEEELTEFEKAIKDMIKPYAAWPDDIFKEESAKLLFLAREQFIKDGYVIEKKAFHDAIKKVSPEVMKEVSKNVDAMNEALHLEHEKDLILTWEDIAMIDAIILDTNNEIAIDSSKKIIGQNFYEEVLKRFNELKK